MLNFKFYQCSLILSQKFEGKSDFNSLCPQYFLHSKRPFHYHISLSKLTLYHLNALLELCVMSVPDFSILQALLGFGGVSL